MDILTLSQTFLLFQVTWAVLAFSGAPSEPVSSNITKNSVPTTNTTSTTRSPTAFPTKSPTLFQCDGLHPNWNDLETGQQSINPQISVTMDEQTLKFHLSVQLPYMTSATVDGQDGYGTSYVIDFNPFSGHSDSIYKPNNCENRIASSYYPIESKLQLNQPNINHEPNSLASAQLKPFQDWWSYSTTPYVNGHLGSDNYLAYGPTGQYWKLSLVNKTDNICGPVEYSATFHWSELIKCTNSNGICFTL